MLSKDLNDRLKCFGFIRKPLFISAALAVVTIMCYIRVLSADFVMFDDNRFIYDNPTLGPLTIENLRLIFTNVTVSSTWYSPLTGLRWCITYQICQLNPLGYHLGNLLLHAANTVLVFHVLRKLLIIGLAGPGNAKPWRITVCASIGAMLWSLHPMQAETVSWAVNAYGQAMLFLFISLLCYLGAAQAKTTRRRRRMLTASLVIFSASLLTQPLGIGYLAVLFILDVYPLGRLGGNNGWWKSASARRALLEKIPFIATSVAVVLINIIVLVRTPVGGHGLISLSEFGLFERFTQAMYIWAYYIWRPWYPLNLSPVYTTLVSFNPYSLTFIASAAGVISGTIILILLRRRWPLGLALGTCHLVMLVPVLGLTDHPHFASDRYSTLVLINWSILIAAWLAKPETKTSIRRVVLVLSILVIGTLGFLSFRQTRIWNNSVVLFEHVLKTLGDDPYRSDIYLRLGIYFAEQGKTDQAIENYNNALKIKPDFPEVYYYLGNEYYGLGRYHEAIEAYSNTLILDPDDAELCYNLGNAYFGAGRYPEAIEAYKQAISINPDYPDTHSNLGAAYGQLGLYREAIDAFKQAIKINPNDVDSHYNLGLACLNIGDKDSAIQEYKILKTLDVEMADELYSLINK